MKGEHFKTLLREIKVLNRQPQIRRLDIIKTVILPKLIDRFNANPIKTRVSLFCFVEIDNLNPKFMCQFKKHRIAKIILKKLEYLHSSTSKLYKTPVMKIVCCCHMKKHRDQWNKIRSPEMNHLQSTDFRQRSHGN